MLYEMKLEPDRKIMEEGQNAPNIYITHATCFIEELSQQSGVKEQRAPIPKSERASLYTDPNVEPVYGLDANHNARNDAQSDRHLTGPSKKQMNQPKNMSLECK